MGPQGRFGNRQRAAQHLFDLGHAGEKLAAIGVGSGGDEPQLTGALFHIGDALLHRGLFRAARRRQPRAQQRVVQR